MRNKSDSSESHQVGSPAPEIKDKPDVVTASVKTMLESITSLEERKRVFIAEVKRIDRLLSSYRSTVSEAATFADLPEAAAIKADASVRGQRHREPVGLKMPRERSTVYDIFCILESGPLSKKDVCQRLQETGFKPNAGATIAASVDRAIYNTYYFVKEGELFRNRFTRKQAKASAVAKQ